MTGITEALISLRPNAQFHLKGSKLTWLDPKQTEPTQEEIEAKIEELELAEPMRIMREQRDQLLKESDVYMFDDYPTSKLAEWKTYRQQLRDMPENETPLLQPDGSLSNVTWPTKPE